jgi:hypothetical protein
MPASGDPLDPTRTIQHMLKFALLKHRWAAAAVASSGSTSSLLTGSAGVVVTADAAAVAHGGAAAVSREILRDMTQLAEELGPAETALKVTVLSTVLANGLTNGFIRAQ